MKVKSPAAPTIPCPVCKVGKVSLSGPLLNTYRMVEKLKTATSAEVWRETPEKAGWTAITNRLNRLYALGVLVRKKEGRGYRFKPVNQKA